jgi:uncharacterized membrane protein
MVSGSISLGHQSSSLLHGRMKSDAIESGRKGLPKGLVPFTAAYLLAAVAGSLAAGNKEFVFYIVVMLVLIGAIGLVHRRVGLSAGLLWALTLWGLLHMAGGLVPVPSHWPYNPPNAVLYSLWLVPDLLKYDQLVHAYGFAVTTWLCWQALSAGVRDPDGGPLRPRAGVLTLCAAGGMGFGAFNEVIEFIATLTMPNTNVGGYLNTGWDLVANLIGSVAAALLIRWRNGGPAASSAA